MSSVNKAILLGRLGKDPEMRSAGDGSLIAKFTLATSSYGKDKKEHTEWHNVIAFNKAAEVVQNYCKKGSQIYLEGSISTNKYTDKDGTDRFYTNIILGRLVMLGKSDKPKETAEDYAKASGGSFDALKDDIPF